jgi:hypothetical protein
VVDAERVDAVRLPAKRNAPETGARVERAAERASDSRVG